MRKMFETFSEAYNSLPDTSGAKTVYDFLIDSVTLSVSVSAYLKLRVIVSAFNGKKRSPTGYYYEPHYRFEDDKMITMHPRISCNHLLGFVSQRDAIYAANTFKTLYADYYLG